MLLKFMPKSWLSHSRRNFIAGFAGGFFVVEFLSFLALTRYWISISPETPDPSRGHIYAHNEHGWITFFTAFEATASALMFWSGMTAVLVCMAIAPKTAITVTRWRGMALGVGWKDDDPLGKKRQGAVVGALVGLIAIFLMGPPLVGWLNGLAILFTF